MTPIGVAPFAVRSNVPRGIVTKIEWVLKLWENRARVSFVKSRRVFFFVALGNEEKRLSLLLTEKPRRRDGVAREERDAQPLDQCRVVGPLDPADDRAAAVLLSGRDERFEL